MIGFRFMQHKDTFLLETIVEFCDRIIHSINENPQVSYEKFKNSLDLIDQCAFRVEQIGENVGDLSDNFKKSHPEIAWQKIVGFRNIIAHAYGTVNSALLWDVITEDIPVLRDFCVKLIQPE